MLILPQPSILSSASEAMNWMPQPPDALTFGFIDMAVTITSGRSVDL